MIRALLQGAWNLGHWRRYQRLEDRVERLEYWVRIHSPLLMRKNSVPSPYENPTYDPLQHQLKELFEGKEKRS